jgi:hypothetical protein
VLQQAFPLPWRLEYTVRSSSSLPSRDLHGRLQVLFPLLFPSSEAAAKDGTGRDKRDGLLFKCLHYLLGISGCFQGPSRVFGAPKRPIYIDTHTQDCVQSEEKEGGWPVQFISSRGDLFPVYLVKGTLWIAAVVVWWGADSADVDESRNCVLDKD